MHFNLFFNFLHMGWLFRTTKRRATAVSATPANSCTTAPTTNTAGKWTRNSRRATTPPRTRTNTSSLRTTTCRTSAAFATRNLWTRWAHAASIISARSARWITTGSRSGVPHVAHRRVERLIRPRISWSGWRSGRPRGGSSIVMRSRMGIRSGCRMSPNHR